MYLRENEDWKTYIKECVEPIIELEKGKLCQDQNNNNSGSESDENMFDDDFIRSDFAQGDSENLNQESAGEAKDGDDKDQQKFVNEMQAAFGGGLKPKRRNSKG